jgi:hypothetical protein
VNKKVDSLNEYEVVNWISDLQDMMMAVNEQLEQVDTYDFISNYQLLEKQDNLQYCIERLNERLDDILTHKLNYFDVLTTEDFNY